MIYNTQEAHDSFRALFKDRESFLFHPEDSILNHFAKLEYDGYVKECVIGWLENKDTPKFFTKKECYQAIGLQKANRAFNKFWNFLTAPRIYDHYMAYDKETKTWCFFS